MSENRIPNMPKTHMRFDTSALFFFNFFLYLIVVATGLNIWEGLHEWTRKYESFEIDELFSLILINSFLLTVYSLRRWQETRQQLVYQKWITEQYQIEKNRAETADQAKSMFLANTSHEIRTPINGIIGSTELLLDTKLDKEQTDYAQTAKHSSEILLNLINELLDFSKIEAGQLSLETEPFILRDCVEQAIDLIAMNAHKKQLNVSYFIEPNIPEILIGDITRLRQVLINLLSNALKFTAKGEIKVQVSIQSVSEDNHYTLQFLVQDTGGGIPEDKFDNLFKAFVQADASITRKHGGTGLGLAISKDICKLMGGKIWLESQVDKGTTFFFTITVPITKETAYPHLHHSVAAFAGKKALIYTQQASNLKIIESFVQQWGMTTEVFQQVIDFMSHLEIDNSADIIILDMMEDVSKLKPLLHKNHKYLVLNQLNHTKPDLSPFDVYFLPKPFKPRRLYETLLTLFVGSNTVHIHDAVDNRPSLPPAIHLNILLAKDNQVNQKIAVIILKKLGYDVDVANNGLEVLEKTDQKQYDIVLMDMQMPEMDGLTATKELIRQYPNSHPIVIAMTANATAHDKQQCFEVGMSDYLLKPINRQLLAEKLIQHGNQIYNGEPRLIKNN
ncbi:ATP-binding protein [Candidatus Albibeggiatoa sp. nov. BB20]|uniref:ATP-binding protein n=1 Tax=Candidatus Albibeggiatoa sp. nov. BB20 TaxID=3162723 RepID=UPI0033655259